MTDAGKARTAGAPLCAALVAAGRGAEGSSTQKWGSAMSQHEPYHTVVARLEGLTDAELCAVVAPAQSLLLDRPGAPEGTPLLTVEVVTGEEAWLLAYYRALPQRTQRHMLQSLAGRDAARAAQQREGERRRAAPRSAAPLQP